MNKALLGLNGYINPSCLPDSNSIPQHTSASNSNIIHRSHPKTSLFAYTLLLLVCPRAFKMRTAILISALLGLAAAIPRPQDAPDWVEVDDAEPPAATGPQEGAVSEPVTYNDSAEAQEAAQQTNATLADPAKHKKIKRGVNDDCAPQPDGYGPQPTPDTVSAFLAYPPFASTARNAPTPHGYTRNFVDLNASSNANTYLGLYTFNSYDTQQCADKCNAVNVCTGFNIYFERDPTVKPAAACPNPASFTNIKCTLWGANVTTATAVNKGQYRRDFHVVIRGSNGYSKPNPPDPFPGYTGPSFFPCAINAPLLNGVNTYIGQQYFKGPFDAGKCAAACNTTTAYDHRHPDGSGKYDPCNFFNAYLLTKNGLPDGTACSLYTIPWGNQYATNCEQHRGSDHYTIDNSYGYSLNPQDAGHI